MVFQLWPWPSSGKFFPDHQSVTRIILAAHTLTLFPSGSCKKNFSHRYSNAGVCFAMGELMLTAGAIILGSSSADFQGYLVGFILLGIGGSWTSFSVLFLSELLPHRRSLTLSLLIAATDASGGVPYILLLISQSVPAADLSFLMLAYAGVPFCAALAATWLFGLTRTRTGANVPQHSTFHSSRSSLLMARVSHLGTLRTTTSNYDLPTAAIEESISTSSVFSPAPLSGETHSDDGMGDGAGKGASERGDNDDDDFVSCRETLDSTSMKSEAEKRSVTGAAGAERRMAVTDAMPPFAPSTSISAGAQSRATNAHRLSHSSQTSQPNQDRPGSSLTRVRSFQSRRSHPQGVANSRLSTITEAPSGSFGQHLSQPSTITRDKTPLVTVGARHSGMSGTQRLLLSPRPDVDAGGADGVVEVCWIPVRTVRQAVSNVGFLLATVFICTVGTAKYFFMENFQQIVEFDTGRLWARKGQKTTCVACPWIVSNHMASMGRRCGSRRHGWPTLLCPAACRRTFGPGQPLGAQRPRLQRCVAGGPGDSGMWGRAGLACATSLHRRGYCAGGLAILAFPRCTIYLSAFIRWVAGKRERQREGWLPAQDFQQIWMNIDGASHPCILRHGPGQ